MVIPARVGGLGGTATFREAGGGEVDNCAWIWPSTLGIDITVRKVSNHESEKKCQCRTDVLGFDICMDKFALLVQVLQAKKKLLGNYFDEWDWHASGLVPFDERQKVFAQRLEHDANMDVG